jgi:hypothetical protein
MFCWRFGTIVVSQSPGSSEGIQARKRFVVVLLSAALVWSLASTESLNMQFTTGCAPCETATQRQYG